MHYTRRLSKKSASNNVINRLLTLYKVIQDIKGYLVGEGGAGR